MMRNLAAALLVTALAIAASAAPASAQVELSIAGGPSLPLGDFGDVVGTGFHGQASLRLSLPLLPVSARVDGLFNQFPMEIGDADMRVLAGSVNAVLSLPSVGITPYLIGGVGLYNSRLSGGDGTEPALPESDGDSTTDFGANIGAGVSVGLPGLSVFGEARLHNIFGDGGSTRFVPISVGLRF